MTRNTPTLHVVSLGCPKNRVDSELMVGSLLGPSGDGYRLVQDPAQAEVILVNTCSFLQQAIEESIDTILELARNKEVGRCRRLLVAGCLVQSHGPELAEELPEVDGFLGLGELQQVVDAAGSGGPRLRRDGGVLLPSSSMPRLVSLRGGAAYLKISEGCNRSCSFCRIPDIRGPQQDRALEDVVAEAHRLAEQGVVELNLVAQDLTSFGRAQGRAAGGTLVELLDRLEAVPGVRWIRLLYLYPSGIDDALLERLGAGGKVLPYVDLPLQHVSDQVLRAMRRGHDRQRLLRLIERIRRSVPGSVLRSAFIVGFPGESEADFEELCTFVREVEPERVAVFRFSPEPGTAAAELAEQVERREAARRHRKLAALARRISAAYNRRLLGQTLDVLVEGPSEQSELLWEGRTVGQAPEGIDGVTYLPVNLAPAGTLTTVRISEAHPHDLTGLPFED